MGRFGFFGVNRNIRPRGFQNNSKKVKKDKTKAVRYAVIRSYAPPFSKLTNILNLFLISKMASYYCYVGLFLGLFHILCNIRSSECNKLQPMFLNSLPNITVAVGRDVALPCLVKNLQGHQVL